MSISFWIKADSSARAGCAGRDDRTFLPAAGSLWKGRASPTGLAENFDG
jgi:hypothetical protein